MFYYLHYLYLNYHVSVFYSFQIVSIIMMKKEMIFYLGGGVSNRKSSSVGQVIAAPTSGGCELSRLDPIYQIF